MHTRSIRARSATRGWIRFGNASGLIGCDHSTSTRRGNARTKHDDGSESWTTSSGERVKIVMLNAEEVHSPHSVVIGRVHEVDGLNAKIVENVARTIAGTKDETVVRSLLMVAIHGGSPETPSGISAVGAGDARQSGTGPKGP